MSQEKPLQFRKESIQFDPVAEYLRERYPVKTAEAVAATCRIPAKTVQHWLNGRSQPGFAHTLTLARAFGPRLLLAAYGWPPEWLLEAEQSEEISRIRAELDDIDARVARLRAR